MKLSVRRSFLGKVLVALVAFVPAARMLVGKAEGRVEPSVGGAANSREPTTNALPPSNTPPPTPSPPPTTPVVEQRFSAGTALSVSASQIVINSPNRGSETIHLSAQTDIWEGRWVKDIPAAKGDTITAWGQRQADGSLNSEKLWINIENIIGKVSSAANGAAPLTFEINDQRQGHVTVKLDPRSLVARQGGQKAAIGGTPLQVSAGEAVQVVGREASGTILATDVYIDS